MTLTELEIWKSVTLWKSKYYRLLVPKVWSVQSFADVNTIFEGPCARFTNRDSLHTPVRSDPMNTPHALLLIIALAGQVEFLRQLNQQAPEPPRLERGRFNGIQYFRLGGMANRVMRYGEFYGGGAGAVALSPSGRYLAIQGFAVCGICCTTSTVMIADLFEHRMGAPKPGAAGSARVRELISIKRIDWVSPTEIIYAADWHREDECRTSNSTATKTITRRIKLSDVDFRGRPVTFRSR